MISYRGCSGRRPAKDSTNNTTTATTLISVDQAILVRMQNENEALHKLVMELQASNAQLQSQLLDIQVSNTITNNTNTTTAINKNVHNEVGHSSVISSIAQTKHTQSTDNDVIQSVPKIYKPPPITACGVNDIQNLVTILTREEVAGHEQQLKTFANGDIKISTEDEQQFRRTLKALEINKI